MDESTECSSGSQKGFYRFVSYMGFVPKTRVLVNYRKPTIDIFEMKMFQDK